MKKLTGQKIKKSKDERKIWELLLHELYILAFERVFNHNIKVDSIGEHYKKAKMNAFKNNVL